MLKFISNTWGSGEIRGKQIAERLRVPCDGMIEREDIVVAVKARVLDAEKTLDYVRSLWLDVVDGYGLIEDLVEHPRLKAIAIGSLSERFIRNRTRNKIVVIPEHHCNFENVMREDREVRVVGAVCYPGNFDLDINTVTKALASIGIEFRMKNDFKDRQDIIDFYKSIDIQLCYRFWRGIGQKEPPELKNPLKLENAGSFKIPTIAYPEPCFVEEFGSERFVHVLGLKGIVAGCKMLKTSKDFYTRYAESAHERAQDFHIDKIAPLYLELD